MDLLQGTLNGSYLDNTDACEGVDGDDDAIQAGNQIFFDDCAHFCCKDVGESVMVVMRVFDVDPGDGPVAPSRMSASGDLYGRFTDCMVEVEVQDKSTPIVVAPPDLVVSCEFWFDDSEDALSDPDNPTFGKVVPDIAWRKKVKTNDIVCEAWCEENRKTGYYPNNVQNGLACDHYRNYFNAAHPDEKYELVWGFDGYVLSSCGTDFEIRIIDNRECGQGLIIREVRVTRGNQVISDRQHIWVVDCDPFYISDDCYDPDDDIIWPLYCRQPDPLEGCGADISPDNPNLGRPVIDNGGDDNCALIIVDYRDETYTIEPDACFKVIRTWIVIDWCQYDPTHSSTEGRWEYRQIIKVLDTKDPVVTCEIGPCEPAVRNAQWSCDGHIELTVDADDECTPDNWLNYEYKIDIDDDGTYDVYSGPAKPGQVAQNYHNPYADDEKDPTRASGTYPFGWHRITWFIEDGCGNVGTCDTVFHILDCKRPTPYCKTGIITVVMPSSGSIAIWANDLDAGSFDNCTHEEDLKFYFNGDESWTGYVVNCDTFANRGATGSVRISVQVWVEDEEGNADYCTTIIEVQDPNGVCGGTVTSTAVAGKVFTEEQNFVQDVQVTIHKDQAVMADRMTLADGYYAFMNLEDDYTYMVDPKRDDDYTNGVSTGDLVRIQRHLLGKADIASPYKLIAADANDSKDISAADIALLRKLILGSLVELPNVDSWRFVPADYVFEDLTNPWHPQDFPETMEYVDLNAQMMNTDFVAIKVGDIDGNAKANGLNSNGTRSGDEFTFNAAERRFNAGETVVMKISADEYEILSGFQFTVQFDEDVLAFEAVNATSIGVSQANYNMTQNGFLTMSWNDFGSDIIGKELFELVFVAKSAGTLSENVLFNSAETTAEAYDQEVNVLGVNLQYSDENGQTVERFELHQNVPNPFKSYTTIGFELPNDLGAVLTIYDVMGKVVSVINIDGQKGYNEIEVTRDGIANHGVLYYQLDAGSHTATRKMLIIK